MPGKLTVYAIAGTVAIIAAVAVAVVFPSYLIGVLFAEAGVIVLSHLGHNSHGLSIGLVLLAVGGIFGFTSFGHGASLSLLGEG